MKLKHLLALASLMIGGGNLWAQSVGDVITYNDTEYKVTGANLITNGSFDDGVNNWNAGDGSNNTSQVAANASNFTVNTSGGFDNGAYLQYSAGGAKAAKTIKNRIQVESGKTYLFRCYTSGNTPSSDNLQYSKIWASDDGYAETTALYQLQWGASAGQTSSTWKQNDYVFTATKSWVVFRSSWTSDAKLDGFFLGEVKPNTIADATDYANLNSAISAVEGKTWGFDAGEYAPYNNVEVLHALATAKAINQDAENPKSTIQALTSTLNTAMTANAAEVNAIWDASFEHDYSGQSGNINPIGWQRVKDAAADGYNVRLMNGSNAGLAATSSGKAIFTKQSAYYGYAEGYTMPLNANTYYTISFIYGGWGDCKSDGYISMADPEGNAVTLSSTDLPLAEIAADTKTSAWYPYSSFFKTGAAGDYALGLRKKNYDTSGQSQYVYGDFVLKTTTVAEATAYYNSVKTSVEGDYEESVYGGNEKTAFKNALDASMEGKSVAEIFAAASDLQTKHDTYVAAKPNYAKFIAEKNSAIAIGVTTETANAVTMSTKDDLETALQALYALEDAAATSGYGVNATTLFGSWTPHNLDTKNNEHWSGTTVTYYDKWQNSGFTASITSTVTLPAGKYVFKLAARAQSGGVNGAFNMSVKIGDADAVYKDFVAKDNTGKGIDKSGAVNYGEGDFTNNGNGRGWEWRFIGFELDAEASVTMTGYAQIYANHWVGFSDATLLTTSDNVGVLKDLLNAELTVANGISTTANVGTGAFQIPSSAVSTFEGAKTTAQGVYDNTDATSEQVSNAITALQAAEETYKNAELNAPADGARYRIKSTTATGASWKDKYYMLRPDASQANGGYSTKADVSAADYLAIAWKFTAVTGGYTLSMTDADGATRYLCTNIKGYGQGSATQIRTTTESEKALVVKVIAATGTDGRWFLQNTEDNSYLGGQDAGLYSNSQNYDLAIEEASQAEVTVSCKAGKFGTVIFPFTPDVSTGFDGITFYTIESVNDATGNVQLTEVAVPEANVPYLIKNDGTEDLGQQLTGWGTATADSYTKGLLTGVYTSANINGDNRYVLQTQDAVQAFYKVNADFNATAYKCYLTYAAPSGVKSFGFEFGGNADAIQSIEATDIHDAKIFNLAGQRMNGLKKGINIVNGKKVLVK